MENSASFIAIEAMIRQGWVSMSFAELEKYLETFEQKGLISSSEHAILLDLARKLKKDKEASH